MPSRGNKKGALDSEQNSRPAQRQKQDGGVDITVTTGANVESETKTRKVNTSSRNSSKSKEATSAGEQQVIGDDLTITSRYVILHLLMRKTGWLNVNVVSYGCALSVQL